MELCSCGTHTCTITTHTLTTPQLDPDSTDDITSTTTHTTTLTTDEPEFRGHRPLQQKNFFGIHHTLTGDISKAPLKCLASAYMPGSKRLNAVVIVSSPSRYSYVHSSSLFVGTIPYVAKSQLKIVYDLIGRFTRNISGTPNTQSHSPLTPHFFQGITTVSTFHHFS